MSYDDNNVFAKILRGDIPCEKIFENEHILSFMDIMPQVNGHCLVVPKSPSIGLLDADPAIFFPLFSAVQHIGNAAKLAFNADGITVMQFNGAAAGQTVFHLHVHILPRLAGIPLKPHTGQMEDIEIIKENAHLMREALTKLGPLAV